MKVKDKKNERESASEPKVRGIRKRNTDQHKDRTEVNEILDEPEFL